MRLKKFFDHFLIGDWQNADGCHKNFSVSIYGINREEPDYRRAMAHERLEHYRNAYLGLITGVYFNSSCASLGNDFVPAKLELCIIETELWESHLRSDGRVN